MALSGTTTYTDMYYFEDTVAEETKAAGMRGVLGETIIGFPAPDYKTAAGRAGRDRDISQELCQRSSDRARGRAALHLHQFGRDSGGLPALGGQIPEAAGDSPVGNQEGERRRARRSARRLPRPRWTRLGVLDGWTVAAHGVWLDDADLAILKARGTGLAHCPSSNMMLASGVAPVVKILSLGIPMGLGTDGVAGSNNDVNMMEEMDLAAKLQKVSTNDPRALPAEQAFAMATILGAQARCAWTTLIGSIEPGKRADLIAIRLDAPNAVPMYNVYSQLVYALKGSDVSDVMVNGKTIVRDRQMLTDRTRSAKAGEWRKPWRVLGTQGSSHAASGNASSTTGTLTRLS